MACRKLAVAHPILLLRCLLAQQWAHRGVGGIWWEDMTESTLLLVPRHLPMIAALLHGRTHLNFQEFRQQNHLAFFLHVLGILELLQPRVFQSEHQGALWDCLRSFIRLLLVGARRVVPTFLSPPMPPLSLLNFPL